jgi:hypothetical protein
MKDITGEYALYDGGGTNTAVGLVIFTVDATGNITNAKLDDAQIVEGHYNEPTDQIFFTAQHPIGHHFSILGDFFTGLVVFDAGGEPLFMNGVHHHLGRPPQGLQYGSLTSWVALFQNRIIG